MKRKSGIKEFGDNHRTSLYGDMDVLPVWMGGPVGPVGSSAMLYKKHVSCFANRPAIGTRNCRSLIMRRILMMSRIIWHFRVNCIEKNFASL